MGSQAWTLPSLDQFSKATDEDFSHAGKKFVARYIAMHAKCGPISVNGTQFSGENTPEVTGISGENTPEVTKLFDLNWNRVKDEISTGSIEFNAEAKTKREILSTIAKHFDIFNFNAPLLNRSKPFLHELQLMKDVGWDDILSPNILNQWKNIANQANSAKPINIPRCVGNISDTYSIIACCDASKVIYACSIYLKNMKTKEIHFLCAKNKIVNKTLCAKSIPLKELTAIFLATELTHDILNELSGS